MGNDYSILIWENDYSNFNMIMITQFLIWKILLDFERSDTNKKKLINNQLLTVSDSVVSISKVVKSVTLSFLLDIILRTARFAFW